MSAHKKRALVRVTRTAEKAKAASRDRNEAIIGALEFSSLREVAQASGLSPARIHQIRHGR